MILYGPVCSQDQTNMAMQRINPIRYEKPYDDCYEIESAKSKARLLPNHEREFHEPISVGYPYDIRNDQVKFEPIESSDNYIIRMCEQALAEHNKQLEEISEIWKNIEKKKEEIIRSGLAAEAEEREKAQQHFLALFGKERDIEVAPITSKWKTGSSFKGYGHSHFTLEEDSFHVTTEVPGLGVGTPVKIRDYFKYETP
jgi:hypothetical protein